MYEPAVRFGNGWCRRCTGLGSATPVRRSRRVVELPGDRYRLLADVAAVVRRSQKPERAIIGSEAGE
jgi:hypothetical protein